MRALGVKVRVDEVAGVVVGQLVGMLVGHCGRCD